MTKINFNKPKLYYRYENENLDHDKSLYLFIVVINEFFVFNNNYPVQRIVEIVYNTTENEFVRQEYFDIPIRLFNTVEDPNWHIEPLENDFIVTAPGLYALFEKNRSKRIYFNEYLSDKDTYNSIYENYKEYNDKWGRYDVWT
jgi:hypothetical protein